MASVKINTHSLEDGNQVWVRAYTPVSEVGIFERIDDWSVPGVSKAGWGPLFMAPMGPHQRKVMDDNIAAHAPLISSHTALHSYGGTEKGTCLVVAPGPSSGGISMRVEAFRRANPGIKFDVCALNRAGMAPRLKPKYFCIIDSLSKEEWWKGLDAKKTTLLAIPTVPAAAAKHWSVKRGSVPNVRYAYMRDCGEADNPIFEPLEIVFGARSVTTAVVNMLAVLGYDRLVFVGLDLAMGAPIRDKKGDIRDFAMYGDGLPGSKTYVGGEMTLEALGIDGQMCHVNRDFLAQRPAVMCQFEIAEDAGVECINASGRGIVDWKVPMSMEDALRLPPRQSLQSRQVRLPSVKVPTATLGGSNDSPGTDPVCPPADE